MAINPNPSLSHHDKFGAALTFPNNVVVPVVALVDLNGSATKTVDNGDGTSTTSSVAGAGAVAELTYPSSARTTSNVGDSFTTTQLTSLAVDATVTAFAGGASPTITFFVDRFGNDSVWYRIWTSTAISSASAVSVSIGPGQSGTNAQAAVLTNTARFGWIFANSPTSVTFSASVVGR